MTKSGLFVSLLFSMCAMPATGQERYESDVFPTSKGELTLVFLGHGTLMLDFSGKTIHIDPYGQVADYTRLPKADLILITHEHGDHLDAAALAEVRTSTSRIITTQTVAEKVSGAEVLRNGESRSVDGVAIEAVAAYNIVHKRDNGQAFHPKGVGNGYILTFGDTRVYIAGDTENTPEMKALTNIDIAFLPMNLPYTMTPEMVADAVRAFKPRVLYPYHFSGTDPYALVKLLKDDSATEVRVRSME